MHMLKYRPLMSVVAMAAAALLSSCGSKEAGQTLTVNIPYETNGALVDKASPTSAQVNYRGKAILGYAWSVVSSPAGGIVTLAPAGGVSGGQTPNTQATFGRSGTYRLRLTVYEFGGTISATDEVTYIVVAAAGG